jgi:Tfp pilus assembly protein PilN
MELRGAAPVLRAMGKEPLPTQEEGLEGERQTALRQAASAVWARTSHSWFERPDLFLLFPDSRVTSRYLEIPSDDPERVRNVISFEVSEEIQLPVEEITWDYLRFSKSSTGTRVLWLATRKSSVEEMLGVLPPDLPPVTVVTPALVGSATLATPAIQAKANQAAIVIDLQAHAATLLVQDEQGVFYTRSVTAGGAEDSEVPSDGSGDLARNLSREVTRTYIYARQRFESLLIKRVLVMGEESESLARELKPPPGLDIETLDHVRALETLGLSKEDAARVPREAASLVAAASRRLTGQDRFPNFAPTVAVGPFSKTLQTLAGAVGGRFVVVAALLLALCVGTAVGAGVWRRNAVEARQAKTTDLLKKVKRLQQEEKILREIQKERVAFSRMFMDFADRIPENITLANISLDLQTKFTMKGKAQSNQDVDSLVKILQEMRYFRDVTVQKTAFEKEGFVFYIEGKIRPGT